MLSVDVMRSYALYYTSPFSYFLLIYCAQARDICLKVFSKHRKFLSMSRDAAFLTLSDKEYCGKMQVLLSLVSKPLLMCTFFKLFGQASIRDRLIIKIGLCAAVV